MNNIKLDHKTYIEDFDNTDLLVQEYLDEHKGIWSDQYTAIVKCARQSNDWVNVYLSVHFNHS